MENANIKSSKEIVLAFYEILFNKERFDLAAMNLLLHEDFQRHHDGHIQTREQIYEHFKGHEKMKQTSDVDFVTILSHGNTVFAHYTITSHKANGRSNKWQVLAKFVVEDGKLLRIEQLSEMDKN